jgi:hypothetical protein
LILASSVSMDHRQLVALADGVVVGRAPA